MKKILKLTPFLIIPLLITLSISCSEKNIIETGDVDVVFSSHQISGCNSSGLRKTTNEDSCFAYSFNDTLKLDFCVTGNCCPDSQRFLTDYKINSDTILVSVSDTAAHLCRCFCNYTIHVELSNLSKAKYLFVCDYEKLKYRESVNNLK